MNSVFTVPAGPYRLRPDVARGAIISQPVARLDRLLAHLPAVDGPPTALFLLPYLAVGGAERLLLDLIRNLTKNRRILIVTTDPHLAHLGTTVGEFRHLTPHVYTLGDWLPKEAVPSAIPHLIRRWGVESLMCWNGNVPFYDLVADLRRQFPTLRIINQLFNHEGGWIEHYSPSVVNATDIHVAVNTVIADALAGDRFVPQHKIATLHHGVEVPDRLTTDDRRRRRLRVRGRLGVPENAVLVGTFIRLHTQKRPLDVLRVAQRLQDTDVHFLLVGGGPQEDRVSGFLEKTPASNLTRLPMQQDPIELYDALDICLMTSSFEGLPVFLLDGLARGIPCVAPAVGEIPLLLEHGGGIAVDRPGDITALAEAIRTLALDPDRRLREGESGRDRVSSFFNLQKFASGYEAVIFPGT